MPKLPALRDFVTATIRAEKARQNLTFAELSSALRAVGITQSATNLSTKVARGGMSASLFLALLKVMGRTKLDLDELDLAPAGEGGARKRARRAKPA